MQIRGLTQKEAERRIKEGYVNLPQNHLTRSRKEIVFSKAFTYFNLINFVLFVFVCLTGRLLNAGFFVTAILNACIGIFQELRSKRLLDRMATMKIETVEVLRDDIWKSVRADQLVLDDVIKINMGMTIPADAEILEGKLEINESFLTGECEPVTKGVQEHIYGGTVILSDSAIVKLIRVGEQCVSSAIYAEIKKESRSKSILHMDMERLIKIVSILIFPAAMILFYLQFAVMCMDLSDSVLRTVAAVVGMIPEGLVVLTSIALAVSSFRLARQDVLVQDFYAIEELARVDTVCFDKTGTLTKGSLKVIETVSFNKELDIDKIIATFVIGNGYANATSDAMKHAFSMDHTCAVKDQIPFSSARKFTAVRTEDDHVYYLGAPSILFAKGNQTISETAGKYTQHGKRVIVLAESSKQILSETIEEKLEPVACIVMEDVLRDNLKDTIAYLKEQNVTIKVISGDDAQTASALSAQAGIANAERYVDLSDRNFLFDEKTEETTVFGRVLPDEKQKIVEALQKKGHVVMMMGDGVNDVPALKAADVSVSVKAAASSAKDSASIVLMDSDFSKIPDIIKEGRRVINNISRASSMYLIKTLFSIFLSFYVLVLRKPYPFLPIHLTVISAFCVGMPTFLMQMDSSFEKIQGQFFRKAFYYAAPSAWTVFVYLMICVILQNIFTITIHELYGMFVVLTAAVYFVTLFRVYKPFNKRRIAIITAMMASLSIILLGFPQLLQLTFNLRVLQLTTLLIVSIVPVLRIHTFLYEHFIDKICILTKKLKV